jgi:hypothetical protein
MFIATMYSYGMDDDSVGVDGIRGCMGVFLAYRPALYAIHLPDNPQRNDLGRQTFVSFIQQKIAGFQGNNARLYGVVNGANRPSALSELKHFGQDLGIGRFTFVRLRKNLGVEGAQQDAAAVFCEYIPHSSDCRLKYQRADDVNWTKGVGKVRDGFYHNGSFTDIYSINTGTSLQSWNVVVDKNNSSIMVASL